MATFTSFSDLLPDPNNKIDTAGVSNASGSAGPGFVKIKFLSNNNIQTSRTISGRGVQASPNSHYWAFDIAYNPMTRTEFDPVSTFLEMRGGGLIPFYVILPQHRLPKDTTFATYVGTTDVTIAAAASAGASTLMAVIASDGGTPSPGDFFSITDPADVNHTKVYRVTRVETNSYYQTGTTQPTTGQRRIHFYPPLVRDVGSSATLEFKDVQFRVRQRSDVFEYELDTDNLYEFSLALEEILP